jgi:PAS domain S-box-containing protein
VTIRSHKDKSAVDDTTLGFDLAGIGLCISRDRVIQRCNLAFGEMFGFSSIELTGQSLERLYPSHEEFENIGSRGLPVMQQSGRYSDERIMMRKDGSLFWCHVTGRARDIQDPFAFAVWSFEDISVKRPVTVALTSREREIAQLLIDGKTSKEIAKVLSISFRTVEAHRAHIIRKFNVKSVFELITKITGLV